MNEKKKLRFNYIFEFKEGQKRKDFKKAINRRKQKAKAIANGSNGLTHDALNKQRNLIKEKEALATIDECQKEIVLINNEIQRLKEDKESLTKLLAYYDVFL